MAKRPKLSIIIINFNSYQFLKECIESIVKSDLDKHEYEVIVVDNASTQDVIARSDSDEAISSESPQTIGRDRFAHPSLAMTIIQNRKNVGFAKANNQAVKHAKGDYILFLNPDTILQKETLSTMLDYMEKNSSVGIATCRVELPSGELDDACHRGFPTPWNALCHFSGLSRFFPKSTFFNGYHLGYKELDTVHEIDSCVGAFMMIRKTAGDQVGWLDEDYFWYGEDIDFCYRAKQKGWKIMYVPTTKIIHYKGVSSGIKKHSQNISSADLETRKRAMQARFDVMRIFYRKHFSKKYPSWLTWFVLRSVDVIEMIH